jgi:hypothetical protein
LKIYKTKLNKLIFSLLLVCMLISVHTASAAYVNVVTKSITSGMYDGIKYSKNVSEGTHYKNINDPTNIRINMKTAYWTTDRILEFAYDSGKINQNGGSGLTEANFYRAIIKVHHTGYIDLNQYSWFEGYFTLYYMDGSTQKTVGTTSFSYSNTNGDVIFSGDYYYTTSAGSVPANAELQVYILYKLRVKGAIGSAYNDIVFDNGGVIKLVDITYQKYYDTGPIE